MYLKSQILLIIMTGGGSSMINSRLCCGFIWFAKWL